jgi:hypothetical protein
MTDVGAVRQVGTATGAVAVLAALVECVGTDQRWSWAAFTDAGFRNLVVAAVVVLLAEIFRSRTGPATPTSLRIAIDFGCGTARVDANPDATLTTPDDVVGMVRGEISQLTALADHLYGMIDLARHEPEVTDETFVRVDDLRWLLGSYVIKGARVRRLVQLPHLLRSIDGLDSLETAGPVRPIGVVRTAAAELLQRIIDTNTATVDWLLTHRVALPDPDHVDTNTLLGRYDQLAIEPISISGDPLYLLTCHIHDILETVEGLGDMDHPVLELLEAQLSGLLTAVESEITAAQAFNTALISLAREVRSADAA